MHSVLFNFKLTEEQNEKLTDAAWKAKMSKAAFLRFLIDKYADKEEE